MKNEIKKSKGQYKGKVQMIPVIWTPKSPVRRGSGRAQAAWAPHSQMNWALTGDPPTEAALPSARVPPQCHSPSLPDCHVRWGCEGMVQVRWRPPQSLQKESISWRPWAVPKTCSGHSKAVDKREASLQPTGLKLMQMVTGRLLPERMIQLPVDLEGPWETGGTLKDCCRNDPLENQAVHGETWSKGCPIMLLCNPRGIRRNINNVTVCWGYRSINHRLGGLNNRNVFVHSSGGCSQGQGVGSFGFSRGPSPFTASSKGALISVSLLIRTSVLLH